MSPRGARSAPVRVVLLLGLCLGLCLGLVVLPPGPATACSCASPPLREQVQRADSIGVGKVAWVTEGSKQTTIAVEFETVYKGRLGSWERVQTAGSGGGCGLDVVESGRRYVFFVDGTHRGVIRASLCGGTTEASTPLEEELGSITGPPYDPVPVDTSLGDEPGGTPWWPWLGGVALLVVGAATWWRLRRSPGEG